jgi:hypothetical protein
MSNEIKSIKPYRFIMNLTNAEKHWLKQEAKKQKIRMATLIRKALSHYRTVLDNDTANNAQKASDCDGDQQR